MKLVGLEFWGQREGEEFYPGESKSFNKKYIYGLISDRHVEIPVGTIVSIKYPEEVQVYNSGFGGGKTIHAIPTRPTGTPEDGNMYGCLFEMAPELNVQMALPEIPNDKGKYNVALNRDGLGNLQFEYINMSPPATETINGMFNTDYSTEGYTEFKAEESFKTGVLKDGDYNELFKTLAEKTYKAQTVASESMPDVNATLGVSELFYNVIKNVEENSKSTGGVEGLVAKLSEGGSAGTWTYGYDINEGGTNLAHMEYEVDYSYGLINDDNQLGCHYHIKLNYTDNTKPSPEEQIYTLFEGSMFFSYDEADNVTSIEFSHFVHHKIEFNSIEFPPIDLSKKAITIANAGWSLVSAPGEDLVDITDILVTGSPPDTHAVFPSNATIGNAAAVTEINKFYGWMFSNFAFYK
jgi:hypothetical protein